MKKVLANKIIHDKSNEMVMDLIDSIPGVYFVSKLDEIIKNRGLTQAKLATLCGLRPSTISEMINCKRSAFTKAHILVIMIALRITDIREIINIEFSPDIFVQFNEERNKWLNEDIIPKEIRELYTKHAKELFSPDIRK